MVNAGFFFVSFLRSSINVGTDIELAVLFLDASSAARLDAGRRAAGREAGIGFGEGARLILRVAALAQVRAHVGAVGGRGRLCTLSATVWCAAYSCALITRIGQGAGLILRHAPWRGRTGHDDNADMYDMRRVEII